MMLDASMKAAPSSSSPDRVGSKASYPVLWAGFVLAALAGGLYSLTLCRFPYPGESARYLALHAGLDPVGTLHDPVWGAIVRSVFRLAGPQAVPVLNALGIPIAIFTLLLVYSLVVRMQQESSGQGSLEQERHREARSRLVSGSVAFVFLGTSAPFWFVATRMYPALWHAFLLAGVAVLVGLARRRGRTRLLWPAALLGGVACMTVPAMVWALPLFGGYTLFILFLKGRLNLKSLCGLGVCFVVGVLLVVPFLFAQIHALADFGSLGPAQWVWLYLRQHLAAVRGVVAGTGWMIFALTMILPWAVAIAWPALDPTHRLNESAAFHLVLAVLAVMLTLNLYITPWALLEAQRIVLAPYLFSSIWIGHVAGYWWLILRADSAYASPVLARLRRLARRIYLPLLSMVLLAGAWRHGQAVPPSLAQPVSLFVQHTVAALPDGTWLLSNGLLDANLVLEAHRQGRELSLINPARMQQPNYAQYVAELADTPRMRVLAELGPAAMLAERLTDGDEARVASLVLSSLFLRHGLQPVADTGIYKGWPPGEPYDADAAFARNERFWTAIEAARDRAKGAPRPIDTLNEWVIHAAARRANDLGVFLEDQARADLARSAYDAALGLNPANLSALLNALTLAQTEGRAEAAALQEQVERQIQQRGRHASFWSLAETYGVVRHPEAYAERGWIWARSGRLDAAVRDLEQVAASESAPQAEVRMLLASLYFEMEDDAQSEAHFQAVLVAQPDNLSALLGLGRIAMRAGEYDEAGALFRRAREMQPDAPAATAELGILAWLSGNPEEAKRYLQEMLDLAPGDVRSLYILGLIGEQQGGAKAAAPWESRLAEIDRADAILARASIAMSGHRFEEARELLEPLTRHPGVRKTALQLLLQLDVAAVDMAAASARARAILEMDVGDGLANLILGSIQYTEGRLPEAEASFRAALRRQPTAEAYNSLAWVLAEQGRLQEGLAQVRIALQMDPAHGAAWDTLGVILHRLGESDRAVVALRRGVEALPYRWDFRLHLAEALAAAGKTEESQAMAEELLANADGIADELRERAEALVAQP